MIRKRKIFGHFLVRLLTVLLILLSPVIAQQQPSPDPGSETPKDSRSDQRAEKPDGAIGKSKLEQETGTINDRIFAVLPNYGTVETAKALQPLNSGQKFRLATAGVFDWGASAFNGALSAIAQARNDPPAWGQGWDAYGKRYGASFADNSIGTYLTTAVFPSLLHEDPRYFQMGQGKFSHRFVYGWKRLFVTPTDSGSMRFNYSESIGNAAAAAISNIYHPADDRTAARNATTFGLLIFYDGLANQLKEFWPDIRRHLFQKRLRRQSDTAFADPQS